MDGRLGGLYDFHYLPGEKFADGKDRIKNLEGEVLTEEQLKKILTPLITGNKKQIDAVKQLQFIYDCRENGAPEYELCLLRLS